MAPVDSWCYRLRMCWATKRSSRLVPHNVTRRLGKAPGHGKKGAPGPPKIMGLWCLGHWEGDLSGLSTAEWWFPQSYLFEGSTLVWWGDIYCEDIRQRRGNDKEKILNPLIVMGLTMSFSYHLTFVVKTWNHPKKCPESFFNCLGWPYSWHKQHT